MPKNSTYRFLSKVIGVRPEETSASILLFLYFFLITFSAGIIKPVKLSLFLDQLTFNSLPFAYLLTAVFMGFVVSLNTRLLRAMKRHVYLSLSLIFFIVSLFIFWILFQREWQWVFYVYWFWSEIFMVTTVTQFWILVNDIYHPRQAKRLVGFLVSGGLLGGFCGYLLSFYLTKSQVIGTEGLLLICPLMLAVCLIVIFFLRKHQRKEDEDEKRKKDERKKTKVGYIESFSLLRKSRHLIFLSGIMVSAIVVTTLIDFQFNSVVDHQYTDKDEQTAFFSLFFAVLMVISFLLHTFFTNRILRRFGIRTALLIAPFLLLVGSAGAFIFMGVLFWWAIGLKGADKSLAHSLNQSVRELLYIPIPPDIKYKAKVFIDMFVNKLARGIGALLILLAFWIFELKGTDPEGIVKYMSSIVVIFAVVWIVLNLSITKEYVNIVKKGLRIKWQDADKLIGEKIDVDMTKLVFDTLESKNRSSVLYAMNLFDLVKKEKMSPELKKIISQKSDEIKASSMDSLFDLDGEVLIPEMEDTIDEEDLDVQVQEIMSLDVYQEVMKESIDKIVREEGKDTEVSRMEAAKVMGMMEPSPSLIMSLSKLIKDESPEVVSYAVESAGKLKRRELVPFIVQHLSNPYIQGVAQKALKEFGGKIIGMLKDYLGDPKEDLKLRKSIPDIISQVGTQRAANILSSELKKKNKDVESEIIAAIFKMRSKNPLLDFDKKIIFPEIKKKIKDSHLIMIEIQESASDKKIELTTKDLENNLARSLRRIFELLSLIYPHEDMIRAYQNICTGSSKALDYSIELLDNVVRRDVMEILLPLIDDIPLEDKAKKSRKIL
ncbi:MAG: MFS transporter, partial [Candidatus Aminicenantes bacterium]